MGKDILTIGDIKLLVDSFYNKVRRDELLGDIFNEIIRDNWPAHLDKMYRFWQTVLLDEHTYEGSPFPRHAKLPVTEEHFDQWLKLFYATIDELFTGKIADEAKWRSGKMAEMFLYKIEYYKDRNRRPIL